MSSMGVKNSYSQGITCPYEVPDQREYYDAGGDLRQSTTVLSCSVSNLSTTRDDSKVPEIPRLTSP